MVRPQGCHREQVMIRVDRLPLVCEKDLVYLLQRRVLPFTTLGVQASLQVTLHELCFIEYMPKLAHQAPI
jgi:hypothetical protein